MVRNSGYIFAVEPSEIIARQHSLGKSPNARGEYAAPGVETAQLVSVVVQEILEISVLPVGRGGNRRIGRLGP